MDASNVDPNSSINLINFITEKNSLIAFELFVIMCLIFVVKTLYNRNIALGDNNFKALLDSTVAINNNTMALNALTKQMERTNP